METRLNPTISAKQLLLRSYLWGMETKEDGRVCVYGDENSDPTYEAWKLAHLLKGQFLIIRLRSYLWGMETNITVVIAWIIIQLRSYLWGMETSSIFFEHYCIVMTPILPMRHGNISGELIKAVFSSTLRSYLWGMETRRPRRNSRLLSLTPILPMRHGNSGALGFGLWGGASLRSYLWGMETYLPWGDTVFQDHWTPILPMRHGNHTSVCNRNRVSSDSDPTYEAWK